MAAPIGNQFWKLAEYTGRPRIFETPEDMWNKALEYFEYYDSNPLMSYEWNGKDPVKCELEKMRAYTLRGFCAFANICEVTFRDYETREDFTSVTTRIRDIMYCQKFEGAAAGLLNPNIIARDLGLVDKQSMDGNLTIPEIIVQGSKQTDADKA